MSLILFLFKVKDLEIITKQKPSRDLFDDDPQFATDPVVEEAPELLCAKITFRGKLFKFIII